MDHDHSYKALFSYPEMVADLLRGFVREEWVNELDFSTLEKVGEPLIEPSMSRIAGKIMMIARNVTKVVVILRCRGA